MRNISWLRTCVALAMLIVGSPYHAVAETTRATFPDFEHFSEAKDPLTAAKQAAALAARSRARLPVPQWKSAAFQTIYTFPGSPGPDAPNGGLIVKDGLLCGMSEGGGILVSGFGSAGLGTAFGVSTSGTLRKAYDFKGSPSDGFYPEGGLTEVNGALYGTTQWGGLQDGGLNYYGGTVFEITTSGERVLHNFPANSKDGWLPGGNVTFLNGTLYGTTNEGGAYGFGTVFAISPSGSEKVIYNFTGGVDGSPPVSGLTAYNGLLYGTTNAGGAYGYGTVFVVSTTGAERVLHSFTGADGYYPVDAPIVLNGILYGTTYGLFGGGGPGSGDGTVFALSTSGGTLTTLHTFTGGTADGENPYAGLTFLNGTLYGTTEFGGADNDGTIFKVSPSGGSYGVLHTFAGGSEGANPGGSLTVLNGALYGTTIDGGVTGDGTIFKLLL